ncbi:uncharacterized protein LOC125461072 isoform X1 [Stegostoma tigrinum]|uniref:uncharacterized protein LOC125461072 isoform X1 n=1 Tax=Stegostoma tigrinum TaxID=3053191 RepID=UPI002870B14B|nr:uncharacterized protein LOC125461072 isoform X1 [Stegostoma tigrinum]
MLYLNSLTLLLLFSAVILTGAQQPEEPKTCGAISLCWEVTSSLTSERRQIYLNSNNVLEANRLRKSGSWSLEPRTQHTLQYSLANKSSTWRIYTMCPPHLLVDSLNGSGAEMSPIQFADLKIEDSDQRYQFQRSINLGCQGEVFYISEADGVALALVLAAEFPLKITTTSTAVSLSWGFKDCFFEDAPCTLLLLNASGNDVRQEMVRDQPYEIKGLTPCEGYTSCLIVGQHDICAASTTDPMPPNNLTVISLSAHSLTVYWDKPALGSVDWFQLDVHLLGRRGEVNNPLLQSYSLIQSGTMVFINELPACQKVNVSIASVCEAVEIKKSPEIFVVANLAPIKFAKVTQTAGFTDGYVVSWSVNGNPSETFFYIYTNGTLQRAQEETEYISSGLEPCTQETLTVEAVCRTGAVADSRTIAVATAPETITNLFYKQTVDGGFFSWTPPPAFHGVSISVVNVLTAFTRKNYYQVLGLDPCTQYQYVFATVCGHWRSEAITRTEFTGCPLDIPPSGYRSIVVLPEKIHFCIYFPWMFSDYMNDPTSRAYLKLATIANSKILQLFLDSGQFSSVEIEMLYLSKSNETVEMNVAADVHFSDTTSSLMHFLAGMNDSNVFPLGGALFWNDEDECANATANDCPVESDCINTFDSFTCICHQGYLETNGQERVCKDHGVFTRCEPGLMKIIVSKEFLADRVKTGTNLVLNDGGCAVKEGPEYYTFTITENQDYCGGQLLLNETHSIFKHVITNEFHSDLIIREEPLIFEVKCAYLRRSLVNMSLQAPQHTRIFKPIVQYHEEKLQLSMTLYKDDTFSPDAVYGASPAIWLNDDLYLEVKFSGAFGTAFVLQIASCWATTTPDSREKRKFHFLQDGCPNDETFRWHSANGASSSSRFSIKMFHFVEAANHPIYLHCQANICHSATTDCVVKECSAEQFAKRLQRDILVTDFKPVNGIVTVGPIDLWSTTESGALDLGGAATEWQDLKVLLWLAGGLIGMTLLILFAVVLMKWIMVQNTQSRTAHA